MYNIEDLLNAREKRVEFIQDLIDSYKAPVIVLKANYPGLEKENSITSKIVEIVSEVIKNFFRDKMLYHMKTSTAEGPIYVYAIKDQAVKIKDISINIEDKHTLGRCVDIDVYGVDGKQLSRTNFGMEMRKCFICNKPAHECSRNRTHEAKEIMKYIADQYNLYLDNMNLDAD